MRPLKSPKASLLTCVPYASRPQRSWVTLGHHSCCRLPILVQVSILGQDDGLLVDQPLPLLHCDKHPLLPCCWSPLSEHPLPIQACHAHRLLPSFTRLRVPASIKEHADLDFLVLEPWALQSGYLIVKCFSKTALSGLPTGSMEKLTSVSG